MHEKIGSELLPLEVEASKIPRMGSAVPLALIFPRDLNDTGQFQLRLSLVIDCGSITSPVSSVSC